MDILKTIIPMLIGFFILSIASKRIATFFRKFNLPGITGMLFTGIMVGPYVLDFLTHDFLEKLHFLNELCLAFIAFYAGTELYLKEIRDKIKKIVIETSTLLFAIFFIGFLAFYFLEDFIPFMSDLSVKTKIAVALLGATIFITRSPSSALAIMKEMRAKGHFTKTAISVTVIIDFVVVVIFAVTFALALNLSSGEPFSVVFLLVVLLELFLAFVFGYILSKIIALLFKLSIPTQLKAASLIILGYTTYYLLHVLQHQSGLYLPFEIHVEALLVCIVASFVITNYSPYRMEFQETLHLMSPYVYVIFFTLTGAHLAIDYFLVVWKIALVLFLVRVFAIMIGTFIGATINKESWTYKTTSWTGYITQAGVGIGLATIVAEQFPEWGYAFYTLILSIIVLNEVVGPALFKFGIKRMGESRLKHDTPESNGRDSLIIGMEPQSVALARQLQAHGWKAKILTRREESKLEDLEAVDFESVDQHDLENLKKIKCDQFESIVLMLSDVENLRLAELIYEEFGNKCLIARVKDRTFVDEFAALGVIVVEPYTALVSLMDNLVRSPNATSILLGEEQSQETLDIEIKDKSFHGMQLKFLRLPGDVLILSIKRKGETIVTHGHTRLKLGDVVTVIGSHQSLEDMVLQFSN